MRTVGCMEFLLLCWDELDDMLGACRHLAAAAVDEMSAARSALALAASGLGAGLLFMPAHAQAGALALLSALRSAF